MQAALTPVKLADGREPHWPAQLGGDNLAPGKPVSYGFGWFLDSYPGHPRMCIAVPRSVFETSLKDSRWIA